MQVGIILKYLLFAIPIMFNDTKNGLVLGLGMKSEEYKQISTSVNCRVTYCYQMS